MGGHRGAIRIGKGQNTPSRYSLFVDFVSSPQLSLSELLQPAISLAEDGFPVAPVTAHFWSNGSPDLLKPSNRHGGDMLLNGHAPKAGEIMRMPHLANTFRVCTVA